MIDATPASRFEEPIMVKAAAQFLGVSPSLVYAYVERKQIPNDATVFRRYSQAKFGMLRDALGKLDRNADEGSGTAASA